MDGRLGRAKRGVGPAGRWREITAFPPDGCVAAAGGANTQAVDVPSSNRGWDSLPSLLSTALGIECALSHLWEGRFLLGDPWNRVA